MDALVTCWHTEDSELHPETGCLCAGEWLAVATDGRKRWVSCSYCNCTWPVKSEEKPDERKP